MTDLMDLLGSAPPEPETPAIEPDGFPFTEPQLEWLRQLETTELPQGRKQLRSERGFCCLGLWLNAVDAQAWNTEAGGRFHFSWKRGKASARCVLPQTEWHRLNLRSVAGTVRLDALGPADRERIVQDRAASELRDRDPELWSLANLNDTGWPFRDIAAFIRRNPAAVFNNLDEKETGQG